MYYDLMGFFGFMVVIGTVLFCGVSMDKFHDPAVRFQLGSYVNFAIRVPRGLIIIGLVGAIATLMLRGLGLL